MSEGFSIGPLFVHWYGVIIMCGALAATFLAERGAKRRGMDAEFIWDALPWVLIAGIIGARIWHILTPPPSMVEQGITTQYYLTHPLDALAIWNGGLGIPGAVMGGLLALYFYARKKKQSLVNWVDVIAPGLALAQGIGRWGNFFNQELYGAPTNLPWAIYIDPAHRLPGYQNIAYYHPLFLYESLWDLGNMAILLWVGRRYADRLKPGVIFQLYLIIYPVGRFLLDFLRLDASQVAGINANQTLSAIVAVSSAIILFIRYRRKEPVAEATPAEPDHSGND